MFIASLLCLFAGMGKFGFDIQKPEGLTYRDGVIIFTFYHARIVVCIVIFAYINIP